MRRLAIFVDAGYFWAQTIQAVLAKKAHRWQIALNFPEVRSVLLQTADTEFGDTPLLRIYWYDGPGDSGGAEEHRAIEAMDDFKLRLGRRNSAGQQKAVDGLIIADLIGLAQNKAISEALIVSGDADLTPGVIAAQSLGLRVHLLCIGAKKSTATYLQAEADRKCFWAEDVIYRYASAALVQTTTKESELAEACARGGDEVMPAKTETVPLDNDERLRQVATSCFEDLSQPLREKAKHGVGLPPEVDQKLLYIARKRFGSLVGEPDRRTLRAYLKALLQSGSLPLPAI